MRGGREERRVGGSRRARGLGRWLGSTLSKRPRVHGFLHPSPPTHTARPAARPAHQHGSSARGRHHQRRPGHGQGEEKEGGETGACLFFIGGTLNPPNLSPLPSPLSLLPPSVDRPRHHPGRRRRVPPLPPHQEAGQARRPAGGQLQAHRHPGLQLHQLRGEQDLHADPGMRARKGGREGSG